MSKSTKAPTMSDDADRMGRIARPGGQEGNMDHGMGDASRGATMSSAVATLNKQTSRNGAAPTVGGRKMSDR